MTSMERDRRVIPVSPLRTVTRYQESQEKRGGFKKKPNQKFDEILSREIREMEELPENIKKITTKIVALEWLSTSIVEAFSNELHDYGVGLVYELNESKESLQNKWTDRHLEQISHALEIMVTQYASRHAAAWLVQFWKELSEIHPSRALLESKIEGLLTGPYKLDRVARITREQKQKIAQELRSIIAGYLKPFEFTKSGEKLLKAYRKKVKEPVK